jgi:hypothetical protein
VGKSLAWHTSKAERKKKVKMLSLGIWLSWKKIKYQNLMPAPLVKELKRV